jgi:hypothetical protein
LQPAIGGMMTWLSNMEELHYVYNNWAQGFETLRHQFDLLLLITQLKFRRRRR